MTAHALARFRMLVVVIQVTTVKLASTITLYKLAIRVYLVQVRLAMALVMPVGAMGRASPSQDWTCGQLRICQPIAFHYTFL